jgi:hypothetical protein
MFFIQIDDFSLVQFLPLDVTDEDSVNDVLIQIDCSIQYGEDSEHKEEKVTSIITLASFLTNNNS